MFNTFSELREGSLPVVYQPEGYPGTHSPGTSSPSPVFYGDFRFPYTQSTSMSVSSESDLTPRPATEQMRWTPRVPQEVHQPTNNTATGSPSARKHSGAPSTKLVLTLDPNDLKDAYDGAYYAELFRNFGFEVFIKGCARRNKLIVAFESTQEAMEALLMEDMVEYRLERYVDVKKSLFPPKASPRTPVFYCALHDLVLRSQRSVKSEQIGIITQGSKVLVNTIRGRRARLVTRTECGEGTEDLGWVSLRTAGADRVTLLRPLRRTMDGETVGKAHPYQQRPSILEEY